MLKYAGYDIVCQEIPDEITLALNLSLCPNNCPGCHSAYLASDIGEELTPAFLHSLVASYASAITCVALMGGDNDPQAVETLLRSVKEAFPTLRTGWYSGKNTLPPHWQSTTIDYIKIGAYKADHGPLSSPHTNQRFYRINNGQL